MIKIAPEVRAFVEENGIGNRLVYVIVEHATTGITVNRSLDCVEKDIVECLSHITPKDYPYHYSYYLPIYGTTGGDTPGHLKFPLTGNHCVFPIVRGELRLSHAVDIHFYEYDRIKMRHYMIRAVGEKKE